MLNFPAFHQWPAVSFENDFSPLMRGAGEHRFCCLEVNDQLGDACCTGHNPSS
jgi:hypothetical protein